MKPVVIIGAGAAGLAAARHLAKAGREVIVLEARDRTGGRIHTIRHDVVPIELGAEFVHGKSPEILDLATATHLKLHEVSRHQWYFADGKAAKSRDFWKQVQRLMDRMKSTEADVSFAQFLNSLPNDEATRRAKDMARRHVEGFHAADIERVSVQGLIKANERADSISGDKAFRFEHGYGSLVEALQLQSETYGARLQLGTIVKEVRWQTDTVQLTAESASGIQTYEASAVIVTVPLALLQQRTGDRIRFIPSLPERKQTAIENLAVGNVIRISLAFRERFWEQMKLWDENGEVISFRDAGFFHSPEATIPTWWTQLPLRAPLLVGWAGGPGTERIGTTGELLEQALTSLAGIFNTSVAEISSQLERSYFHDWRNDRFSLGAYSYLPVNGLAAQLALAEPVANRLFFAGEATCAGHIGTVHGAMQSGERAANEILGA